ncbi:hypothetical protein GCK32_006149 [Trichostrongylus colubriformis]|uniref:Sulfotransferase domain-containing protein n=1 Tax=Trichostrongylus colubriformis TaxID=6319 RepID=A0AAN8IHJ1_TRICO
MVWTFHRKGLRDHARSRIIMQSLSEKGWIILRLQLYAIYLVLQTIYQSLIELVYIFTGNAEIPSDKVRISSIVWRYKVDPEEIAKRNDFVLAPGYLDSVELLNNPHWILYSIEKNVVVFVLLPEPITTYTIENNPFIFVTLFEKALAVAEVSIPGYLKFAHKLAENPQPRTVLFTNTARCGSTLFGKMLNRPGVSTCYAEHPALTVLSIALGEELMSEADVRALLHATVTCLRAHLPVDSLCILKTQSFEARLVPLCRDIPNLKHIFMFRKKALPSVEKVCRRAEFLYLLLLELYHISPFISRCLGTLVAGEGKWVRILRPQNMRAQAAIILASPLSHYERNKEMYCHPIVWFHEIIVDTENVLTSVFNELGIPLSCIADAVECKKVDSQKGSFLSQQNLKNIEVGAYYSKILRLQKVLHN